nr:hypothetical protein [Acrocarpospora catenulata]
MTTAPGLMAVPWMNRGRAYGGYQDVGLSGDCGQVGGSGVAVGDGGVAAEQEHAGGLAEDGAAAHHDGVFSGEVDLVLVEQAQDAGRSAGVEAGQAEAHRGEGVRGNSVDVLFWGDGLEGGPLVDVLADGVLQEDAVHAGVRREGGEGVDEFLGGGRGGKRDVPGSDADLLASGALHADVGDRGRVVADQDGGEAGGLAGLLGDRGDSGRAFFDDAGGEAGAVHQTGGMRRGHGFSWA